MSALKLNYQRFGDGNPVPVIIVHGLFGSLANWRSIARRLEGDFDVVTADLRNHGDSPHDPDMSYPAQAADLERLANDLFGPGPVAFVGHSMGGKAVMELALSRPRHVSRLVVVDIAPVAYRAKHVFASYFEAMRDLDLTLDSRRAADEVLAAAIPDAAFRGFLLQNLRRDSSGALRWRINLDALSDQLDIIRSFPDHPAPCSVPACFVAGAESRYVSERHEQEVNRLFPGRELHRIAGAGHLVHADAPDEVAAHIARFCRG